MTGALAMRILPTDTSFCLAYFLIHMLAPKDYMRQSSLMSILRVMNTHFLLSTSAAMPRWAASKSWFGKSSDFIKFYQKVKAHMLSQREAFHFAKLPPANIDRMPVVFGPDPSAPAAGRGWLTPRLADMSCCSRPLVPGASTSAADVRAFASCPLATLGLESYVTARSRAERGLPALSPTLPFDVSTHAASKSYVAKGLLRRLGGDVAEFAELENEGNEAELVLMSEEELRAVCAEPNGPAHQAALRHLEELIKKMRQLHRADVEYVNLAIPALLKLANGVDVTEATRAENRARLSFILCRLGRSEITLWFEYLVATTLASNSDRALRMANPFLSVAARAGVVDQAVALMLHTNRVGHTIRTINQALSLRNVLRKLAKDPSLALAPPPATPGPGALVMASARVTPHSLLLQANDLATLLATKRHYVRAAVTTPLPGTAAALAAGGEEVVSLTYDPRFLVFEFTHNLVLRKSQVTLVDQFMAALNNGDSMVTQMIMGAGKTTVVAPLLAMLLADGSQLVLEVVPAALLEFSRAILRSRFSAIVPKAVYTFAFDRFTEVTPDIYRKLLKARQMGAIVVSTPSAVKSFALKYVLIQDIRTFS